MLICGHTCIPKMQNQTYSDPVANIYLLVLPQALGSGFEIIGVGDTKLVRSVPTELNVDHNKILEMAQVQHWRNSRGRQSYVYAQGCMLIRLYAYKHIYENGAHTHTHTHLNNLCKCDERSIIFLHDTCT